MQDVGLEIVGPRSSQATMRMLDYLRMNRLPFTWHETEDGLDPSSLPLVRLPGGTDLLAPSTGQVSRALGIGRELGPREEVDLLVVGAGPAGLGAAVYGASEGLDTLVIDATVLGGQAGSSRRIENYLGFPAGISGTELTSRAATQARKFDARLASPFRAEALEPGGDRHVVRLEEEHEIVARAVLLATGAQYRRLPVADLSEYEGMSVFYAAGPPEAQLCGASRVAVVGGGNSAGQAAVWLARGGALVTLLHRRADLRETMSDYLIRELERYGVAVRDRSEISAAPRRRRAARGRDAHGRRAPAGLVPVPLPWRKPVHRVARRRRWHVTTTASSSRAQPPAPITCSRRAFPACSRPATSDPAQRSDAQPRSARAQWRCSSCTPASPGACCQESRRHFRPRDGSRARDPRVHRGCREALRGSPSSGRDGGVRTSSSPQRGHRPSAGHRSGSV